MRIVVTGASGQLGSSLLARLAGGPHEVIAWSGSSRPQGPFKLKPVDLTDAFAVSEALALADADVVIHAAAVTSAEVARREPDKAWAVNVLGTRLLADWAARSDRRLSSPRPIWSSTATAHGIAKTIRPSRFWNTAGPSVRPSSSCSAFPRGLVARLACCTDHHRRGNRDISIGR